MKLKKQVKNVLSSFSRRKVCHQPCKGMVECKSDPISKISSASTESTIYDDDRTVEFHNNPSVIDHSLNGSIRLRSSLKSDPKTEVRPKRVHFHVKKNQLHIVEPYLAYSSDLWWSKEEMNQCRIDFGIELSEYSKEDIRGIREYTKTYHRARRHATISKQQQQQQQHQGEELSTKSKVFICHDDYLMIVHGKGCGWYGLEVLIAMDEAIASTERTREIVRTIVYAYHNQDRQEISIKRKDKLSRCSDNNNNNNNNNNTDADRTLRSLSKSLTSSDRSWAVIMGTADYDALRL